MKGGRGTNGERIIVCCRVGKHGSYEDRRIKVLCLPFDTALMHICTLDIPILGIPEVLEEELDLNEMDFIPLCCMFIAQSSRKPCAKTKCLSKRNGIEEMCICERLLPWIEGTIRPVPADIFQICFDGGILFWLSLV